MTSCYYAPTPTRDSWFQTNQPEHESDDRAGNLVTSMCVTNEKDTDCSGKFNQHLLLICGSVKTKIQDRAGILVLVRVLRNIISKIY